MMFVKVYAGLAALLMLIYATSILSGWEIASSAREQLPASARQSPGGYRSFHFWHSGFSGGK